MFKFSMPKSIVNNSNILPQVEAKLSTFDLSENLTTTIKPDFLYPVYWRELQPNDHFEITVSSLARIMPMVAPTMSNIKMKYFAFWVPNRLLWKKWLNFMGERTFQSDNIDVKIPQISMMSKTQNVTGKISDYLGIPPTEDTIDYTVTALPFRAYNKIWNEWFRANYIQEEVKEFSGDTDELETLENYPLLKKGKPIDYFTSCMPQPLEVDIVLGDKAIVTTDVDTHNGRLSVKSPKFGKNEYSDLDIDSSTHVLSLSGAPAGSAANALYADISQVTGFSIESIRRASSIKTLYEKDMRSGYRYIDMMHEHFGINIPDFLVGRSEFLGSTTTMINSEPILQNSETATTPQGNMAAVGFGVEKEKLCEFSAREHGVLMILACVDCEVTYQQGLDKKFSKTERFDYYFPEFANLGEQPVLEREIMLTSENAKSNKVFGYNPRYKEEREGYNKISGLMRSNVSTGFQSLDVWHLAQKFATPPGLNAEFIQSNTPLKRVIAVQEEDNILLNIHWDVKATRSIPIESNPSIVAGRV